MTRHTPGDSERRFGSFGVDPLTYQLVMEGSDGGRVAQPPADGAAGLVPFKTSPHDLVISLLPSECAERRVKRLKRSVWASGHLHKLADKGHRPPVCWFVTLTYALATAWTPKHISASVDRFRKWCQRRGIACRYTWVAEIQPKRAERTGEMVVHYHLLAWLPEGVSMPFWDRAQGPRKAFWTHGWSNTEKAFSGVGYLMKYLSKLGDLSVFPPGLRLYGIGGLNQQGRSVRTWFNLPQWAKCLYGVGDLSRVAGGLVVRATGEILAPMFRVSFVPAGLKLCLLRALPEKFHDGAYSTFPQAVA
jgi:hypothetical protein